MLVQILFVVAILAAAGLVYGMILPSNGTKGSNLVSKTVAAWRSDDRQLDEFEVRMRDTSVGDVFNAFPRDPTAYVTPETVAEKGAAAQIVKVTQRAAKSDPPSAASPIENESDSSPGFGRA